MKVITEHQCGGGMDEGLVVRTVDEPGPGGAHHEYHVEITNGSETEVIGIKFQKGPVKEVGLNGLSQEVLLAIVVDRLQDFQNGPFACESNQKALVAARESLGFLKSRTLDRIKRQVEGRNIK
jgi:hypothetical protein